MAVSPGSKGPEERNAVMVQSRPFGSQAAASQMQPQVTFLTQHAQVDVGRMVDHALRLGRLPAGILPVGPFWPELCTDFLNRVSIRDRSACLARGTEMKVL